MKKKLALLLVLTMILSAIPMNVFGATTINRGPYQTEANNTYARINVDIRQLAEKGFVGIHTNTDLDGSGYLGIPIEVVLSDNGGSFILDDRYGLPDGQTAAISSNTGDILASIYATNDLQNLWSTTTGSARRTTIESGNGLSTNEIAKAWVGMTSPASRAADGDAGDGTAPGSTVAGIIQTVFAGRDPIDVLDNMTTTSAITSSSAATVPQEYDTKWTARYIDSRHVRFYLQVFNATTGLDVIPDVGALAENALTIDFAVPMYLKDQDAIEDSKLTINALTNQFSVELISGPAVNYGYYSSLMVSTSTIAKIANTGFLDTLKVGEYRANFLNGYGHTNDTAASGKAPGTSIGIIQFRFESPYARLVNNVYSPLTFADYANTFTNDTGDVLAGDDTVTATWGVGNSYTTRTAGDYDLQLTFNSRYASGVSTVKGGTTNVADTLSLKNLMVAFDERMPYGTEVKLQYRTMTNDEFDFGGVNGIKEYSDWTNTTAAVVSRQDNNVELGWVTGRNTNVVKEATDVVGVSGRRDVKTEVIRLKETVPNTWNTATTTFSVPEGVEIVGAHVAIYETNMSGSERTRKEGTVVNGTTTMTKHDNGSDEQVKILRHQNIYNGASIEVDDKAVTLRPMYNAVTNAGQKREVEVQLYVSVEAGFEGKYGSALDLTVESSADLTSDTITIATIHDPITATLDAEVLELPTEANFNVQDYVIGDILISENTAGDLRQSSELWLYVVGSSNLDLTLNANRNIAMLNDDTTLAFYSGVQLRHQYGNFYLNGLRFDVQRASSANGPSGKQAAGEFAIEDVTLTGVVQPGSQYTIIVSGSAVAENDYTVWANSTVGNVQNLANQNPANDDTGIFDVAPYTLDPFTWDSAAYNPPVSEAPPADDVTTTGPVATISAPKTFNAYSYSYDTDANGNPRSYNNFYMAAASNGAGYTGISPKAFAEFVGGTTTFDDATRTATITGINQKTGAEVVVELTLDSTTATIDGVTTDIATYNNVLDMYPVGSIKPFQPGNNRMYVPVRFMANAFQVDFNWDDATKSVTLYPGA